MKKKISMKWKVVLFYNTASETKALGNKDGAGKKDSWFVIRKDGAIVKAYSTYVDIKGGNVILGFWEQYQRQKFQGLWSGHYHES